MRTRRCKPTSMPSQQIRRCSMRISIWDGCCTKVAGTRSRARLSRCDRVCGDEPLLLFNLGVLLDDRGRKSDAIQTYEAALRVDPALADCHYNLAPLYEDVNKPKRRFATWRSIVG